MVRDDLMQEVIRREKEPITPFLERARDLYSQAGISTILVAGSSGAFFYIADKILQMDCYRPVDITDRVKALCGEHQAPRTQAPGFAVPSWNGAWEGKAAGGRRSGDGRDRGYGNRGGRSGGREQGGRERAKVKTFGRDSFSLDRETVDLRYVEQLADGEQTAGLAYLLRYCLEQAVDGRRSLTQVVDLAWNTLKKQGWEPFCSSYVPCGLAKPRKQELFACLNRYRG